MKKVKCITISIIVSVLLITLKSFSGPADPSAPLTIKQKDGTSITVVLKGDEHISWAETIDGFTLLFNKNGIYEYGMINSSGNLVSSGIKAKDLKLRTNDELSFLTSIPKNITFNRSQISIMKQIFDIREMEKIPSAVFPTTGNRKLLCILIGFSDMPFTYTQSDFDDMFNQTGYNFDGSNGSVKDYFWEASYNQLNLTVDVAGPYQASNTHAYYGQNDPGPPEDKDINVRELVTEAVNLADPDVNFADYDNDGDGIVDPIYVIHAGYNEAEGGGADCIWYHAWSIPSVVKDGKTVSSYSTSAEFRGNTGTDISRIGNICHEFGHSLGAPDFYDTNYGTGGQYPGNGRWDVMASGNFNGGRTQPAHPNPYIKSHYYNWTTITTLNSQQQITLQPSATHSNHFYQYETSTPGEFFIFENRQQVGFDASVPGHGLLIFHKHSDLTGMNTTHPQKFYPVYADAGQDPTANPLTYGDGTGDINNAGCTFPGSGNHNEFTDATLPSSKSWADANTGKPIVNITENPDGTVFICFMGCPPVAEFEADELTPCTGETVTFTDLSLYTPTSWDWSFTPSTITFTDGTNASSQNPKVIFDEPGAYTVTLLASNEFGSDTETKTGYINVNEAPEVTSNPVDVDAEWGDDVSFSAAASGTPTPTVQWQLSTDGGSSFDDISGETATTLNLSCITLDMSGYQYRAVFTNVCGTTTTDPATLTVTPKSTIGTVTVIPNPQQYSDLVDITVTLSPAEVCGQSPATGADIYIGTQYMGSVLLVNNAGTLEATLEDVALLEPTPFGTPPTGNMAPGNHTVTAYFTGVNSNFDVEDATTILNIEPEDARAYYTGAYYASTAGINSYDAIITLSATFKDITAVLDDPDWDANAGDLRNATVSFINRDDNSIIAANLPFGLVDPNDPTVAVCTYNWNVNISPAISKTFTVGIIIKGYYTRNSSDDDVLITVSQPLPDFVTGGGFIKLISPAGVKAGDIGSKNNFGFSVKFTKKGTNLQGNVNTMIRRTEADGIHIYKVKSNKLTSLAVLKLSIGGKATINTKASIIDITDPLFPVSIDGNASLQINLSDNGEPGKNDLIAITIWNKAGGLWYASNWNGTKTIEQLLDAGNLKVNSNNSFGRIMSEIENADIALSAFPNPTDGRFTLFFNTDKNTSYIARLTDMTGRTVYSEKFNSVKGINTKVFEFGNLNNGIYMLTIENGIEIQQIKVMLQRQ